MTGEGETRPPWIVLVGLIVTLLAAGLALYIFPVWFVPMIGDDAAVRSAVVAERNGLRTAGVALLVGIGSLGALYFTARNSTVAIRALAVTQRGNVAERYSRAVDHLGSASVDVALGGIYSLEQLAVESERDQQGIVEILSAFVRRRVPSLLTVPDEEDVEPVSLEAQAALTVLGRLPHRTNGMPRADLSGCRLDGVNLRGANLDGADLTSVRFYRTDLRGASLLGCNFTDARFRGSQLQDCTLSSTDKPAIIDVGDFEGTDLSGAALKGAELYRASFKNGMLSDTDFTDAKLCNSSFFNASVTGHGLLHLGKLEVDGPDAAMTQSRGPMIVNGADLRGITDLHQSNLDKTIGNKRTQISETFRRPDSWSR